MKLISNKYNPISLKEDFKYEKNPDIYEVLKQYSYIAASYREIFADKYGSFYKKASIVLEEDSVIKVLYNDIYRNFVVPTIYKAISPMFIPDYTFITDLKQFIVDRTNMLLFNVGVNISEAIFYMLTENNIINKVNMYFYPLLCINNGKLSDLKPYADKLKQYYEGENITFDWTEDEVIASDYNSIINRYQDKKIDLVLYDYRQYRNTSSIRSFEKLHGLCTLIALSVLKDGGTYIFKEYFYSKTYLTQIITFLSKFFEKIVYHKCTIRDYMVFFVCYNYKASKGLELDELDKVLKKWNSISTDCGENNNKHYDLFATNFFTPTDPLIVKQVDLYTEQILQKIAKINSLYDKSMKDVSILPYSVLLQNHKDVAEINYKRQLSFAHQYNLKLSPDFLSKQPNYVKEMYNIYIFSNPITLSYQQSYKFYPLKLLNNNVHSMTSILEQVKQELILYKIGIDTRNAKKWDNITHLLNITQGLIYHFRNKYNVKLSRAYFKMYEIMETFSLVKSDMKSLKSLHICEAPGYFINSIHYYIKTKHPDIEFNWTASSLNPENTTNKEKYGSIIGDDYGLIKKYKNQWLYAADNTGDITNIQNIEWFKTKFGNSVELFTSDCGLSAKTRYEYHSQEEWLGKVNFCQIVTGLITTRKGGSSVFKYFMPFTKPVSVSLIYLLVQHYESVTVFKPLMTSPTNNEVYIVAQNKLKDLDDTDYNTLIEFYKGFNIDSSFYEKIDKTFINHTYYISKTVIDTQINNLKVIYYYYENDINNNGIKKDIHVRKELFAKQWMNFYKFGNLDQTAFL